jgi:hypothetical protein
MFTATIGILALAVLLAVAHQGNSRHFWKGFAICGWIYFFFAFAPMVYSGDAPHFLPEVLLNDIYLSATTGETYFIHELSKSIQAPRPHFVKNGHALLALLFGLGGGFVARFVALRDVPPTSR